VIPKYAMSSNTARPFRNFPSSGTCVSNDSSTVVGWEGSGLPRGLPREPWAHGHELLSHPSFTGGVRGRSRSPTNPAINPSSLSLYITMRTLSFVALRGQCGLGLSWFCKSSSLHMVSNLRLVRLLAACAISSPCRYHKRLPSLHQP
jgi:hypothetical protein